jgi:hypothetical protein
VKLALIVKNSLNGDIEEVSNAVRRTFYALANEMDEQAEDWDVRIADMRSHLDERCDQISSEVRGIRRVLILGTSAIITGIVVGIANVILTL